MEESQPKATPSWLIVLGVVLLLTGLWQAVAFVAFLLVLAILTVTEASAACRNWRWKPLSPEDQRAKLNEVLSQHFSKKPQSPDA